MLRALGCAHRQLWPLRTTLTGGGGMCPRPGRGDLARAKGRKETQTRQRATFRARFGRAQRPGGHRKSEATPGTAFLISEKDHQREATAPDGVGSAPSPSRGPVWARQGFVLPQKALPASVCLRTPAPCDLRHRHPAACRPLPGPTAPRHVRIIQPPVSHPSSCQTRSPEHVLHAAPVPHSLPVTRLRYVPSRPGAKDRYHPSLRVRTLKFGKSKEPTPGTPALRRCTHTLPSALLVCTPGPWA